MVIKTSTLVPDKFFELDGMSYEKNVYTIYYNNIELDTDGNVIKDNVHVGIRSRSNFNQVLVHPLSIDSWNDGSSDFSDLDSLVTHITGLISFNSGGGVGNGIDISQRADTFNDLTSGTEIDQLAYVENSQGTSWLPANLGGTYYPSGWYVWDGVNWVSDRNAVVAELVNNTNNSLGWVQIEDTALTEGSPLSLLTDTRTLLTNDGVNVINSFNSSTNPITWNSVTNTFEPDNSGDCYIIRLQLTAKPSINLANLSLELDIGGGQGVIWDKTIRLSEGAGVATRISETMMLYTLGTFVANGGKLYLTSDLPVDIFSVNMVIQRTYRHG